MTVEQQAVELLREMVANRPRMGDEITESARKIDLYLDRAEKLLFWPADLLDAR